MKLRALAALAATAALASFAGNASAAVTILGSQAGNLGGPLQYGQTMIEDFDAPILAGFSFSADSSPVGSVFGNYVRQGGLIGGVTAPPPVPVNPLDDPEAPSTVYSYETTKYETVETGGIASLNALSGHYMTGFSFYLGSPDGFNTVTFRRADNSIVGSLSGAQIWNDVNANAANGDQGWGRRVYYGFGGDQVTQIDFTSQGVAFEFDGLAGQLGGIPEPTSWALMIMGFGGIGAALRSRRKAVFA